MKRSGAFGGGRGDGTGMVKGVGKGREKRSGRLTDDDDQGGANGGICHGGDDGMNGLVD